MNGTTTQRNRDFAQRTESRILEIVRLNAPDFEGEVEGLLTDLRSTSEKIGKDEAFWASHDDID